MKKQGNRVRVSLEELRSMKGKSRLAELYQEQQSEKLRSEEPKETFVTLQKAR